MLRKTLLATVITSLTTSAIVQAEDGWKGETELGYVLTTGNTDTETTHGKFGISNTTGALTTSLKLEALSGKDNNTTTKEKYNTALKFDYSLTEVSYLTSQLTYEKDRFSGFTFQSTASAGYGHKLVNNDTVKLAIEAGPGYRRDRIDTTGKIDDEAIGRFALDFAWKLSENAEFSEVFTIEAGDNNQIYKSEAALKSTIVGNLAMKISHQAKYVQEVPEGSKRRDDLVGVTLVYGF